MLHRSILKPNSSLFLVTLRVVEPLAAFFVGLAGYYVYLRDQFALPSHYVLLLLTGSVTWAVLFPLFRLYDPQRGGSRRT